MGCSGCKNIETIKTKTEIDKINDKINPNLETLETHIDKNGKLKDEKDFISFCNNDYPKLVNLNLSNNNLTDISELKKLIAPNLKILDLSNNNIKDLDVFKEVNFFLEELYLNGNCIKQIGIFIDAKSLKNLKKLRASINDNDYEKKKIIDKLKKNINNFEYQNCPQRNAQIIEEQLKKKAPTLTLS